MSDDDGQIFPAHSISAGLDYPGVGPEHAALKDSGARGIHGGERRGSAGCVHLSLASWRGSFQRWSRRMPLRRSVRKLAPELPRDAIFVMNLSGRGDKDVSEVRAILAERAGNDAVARESSLPVFCRNSVCVTAPPWCAFLTAGDPDFDTTAAAVISPWRRRGPTSSKLACPFSDPIAEGPVIQRASERALGSRGASVARDPRSGPATPFEKIDTPLVLMGYANPLFAMGVRELRSRRELRSGVDGVIVADLPPEEGKRTLCGMPRCTGSTRYYWRRPPRPRRARILLVQRDSAAFSTTCR